MFAIFTGAAALAENVWQLGLFRFLAGVGIGGEWAMAGTYVAEAWPEDRRKQGAGYLQTGYYAGFFVAAALNFTVGATYGWRAMFLCGLVPVVIAIYTILRVKEPAKWESRQVSGGTHPLRVIFQRGYLQRTLVNAALIAVAIIGLWAGAVYVPTAVITLSKQAGIDAAYFPKMASLATAILSIGTIIGCLLAPVLAERLGRKLALAIYFAGMAVTIPPPSAGPSICRTVWFPSWCSCSFSAWQAATSPCTACGCRNNITPPCAPPPSPSARPSAALSERG